MSQPPRKVVIVGRDAAAFIAGLSMHSALSNSGVEAEIVELPSLLSEEDVYLAVPASQGMHRMLGLDEALIIAGCAGVPVAGQRFANWSNPGFLHPYDRDAPPGRDLEFVQYWLKARQEGMRVGYEDFSLGAVAAKQGRLPLAAPASDTLAAGTGYHLHAANYVALLRQYARRRGIAMRGGRIGAVEQDGERITSVILEGGERIEADLFIDASGAEAALIGRLPGAEFESWRQWLPCDRVLAASAPPIRPLPAYSQISAFRGGWIGLHPLQNRTAVVAAYSTEFTDAGMIEQLPILSGCQIVGDAVVSPFEAGMRRRPWIGNCIAVGDGAISLEPLDAVQLHLLHVQVSLLVTLFPVETGRYPEAEPYNQFVRRHAQNMRDFQIAHYRLNRRFDEPMWDAARSAPGPESLQRKLDVFAARGETILYDDETFQHTNWASIFIGHGLIPKTYDPRIDIVPEQEHIAKVQQRLKTIGEAVRQLPRVEDHLASIMPPQMSGVR